jgi:hypothetical protein
MWTVLADRDEPVADAPVDRGPVRAAEADGALGDRRQHPIRVGGGRGGQPEDRSSGRLLIMGLGQLSDQQGLALVTPPKLGLKLFDPRAVVSHHDAPSALPEPVPRDGARIARGVHRSL